ncbi:MAG: hypothetical protein LBQ93_09175 [Treponema sp.]|jgi:hypothetical protein|nr:hypothetical protein [Treponema sp.]
MGVIKTALEIALEKTENVKSDKSGIDQFKAKQHGKKLANAFLSGEEGLSVKSLVEEINNTPGEQKESLKQGIFDILISQIALPSGQEDEKRFGKIGEGLQTIINNKQFNALFEQLAQVFSQYLQEASHYEQAIRQQYSQRLRQKEEELSRRLGREVRIDPMQDPEFVAFYNQHMNALKNNYEPVVEQAKEEVRKMFND